MTKVEAYRVFGLLENQPVTEELMKNRYRILIKTYHPDNPRTGNEEMMTLINVAFDAITNNRYDDEPGQDNFEEAYEESHDTYDWNRDFDADDFMVDFDPFEVDGAEFAYQYYAKESTVSQDEWQQPDEMAEDATDMDVDSEYERSDRGRKKPREVKQTSMNERSEQKRKNPIIMILKGIGKFCKFLIICMCLACFAGAVAAIVLFGANERGFLVAGGAVLMGGLFILVYRFFGALIE